MYSEVQVEQVWICQGGWDTKRDAETPYWEGDGAMHKDPLWTEWQTHD